MFTTTDPDPWFALRVRPRHEKAAGRNLALRGLESFSPLYSTRRNWSDRVQTVTLPLFPGYVFCRIGRLQRAAALATPGVVSIVGFAQHDMPVGEDEIASLRALLASGLPVLPHPYWREGDRVVVCGGALAGARGFVVRHKDACRLVVSVELLQRSVSVEIDQNLVVAACAAGVPDSVGPGVYSHGRH